MIIHLPAEMDSAVSEVAEKRGTTPDRLVAEYVRKMLGEEPPPPSVERQPQSLADRIADFIGVLHSSEHVPGGARMSEHTGEQFAAGMLEKRAQGRL